MKYSLITLIDWMCKLNLAKTKKSWWYVIHFYIFKQFMNFKGWSYLNIAIFIITDTEAVMDLIKQW